MAAVDRIAYQDLAAAYGWLVPETLLTPEGSAVAFEPQIAQVEPGSRVLDCACGTGTLAVGLATTWPTPFTAATAPTPTRPIATW